MGKSACNGPEGAILPARGVCGMLCEDLFVETHDDSPHYIALLEIFLGTGWMGVMAGDTRVCDSDIGCHPLKMLAIFEGQNPGGRIRH